MKIFDSHLHIISPSFPLVENNGFIPDYFSVDSYLSRMQAYDLQGGVIVSGSFQGYDQSYLMTALEKLGNSFVGVTQLPVTVTESELIKLNHAGVRGIRFNLRRGGSENIKHLETFAKRVFDVVGWHTELYVSAQAADEMKQILISLPAVSIDHLGLSYKSIDTLLFFAAHNIKIKATGFGRVDFDVGNTLKKIYSENPESLMFGTDLPSTRAQRPFRDADAKLIKQLFSEKESGKILYQNAMNFYHL